MSVLLRSASRAAVPNARAFSTSSARSLARISIIGHLADTPEVKPTSTGREVIMYSLATNTGPPDNRKTSWWRISCFADEGKRRDYMLTLPKGTHMFLEGEASIRSYTDAEGKPRTSLSIVQKNFEVLKKPVVDEHHDEHADDQ